MKSIVASVPLAIILVATPARGQEPPDKPKADRLAELEKRVEEQRREIDALKQSPLKAPLGGASKPTEGPAPTGYDWGFNEGFFVKAKINGADYVLRPIAAIQLDYRAFPHAKPIDQFLVRRVSLGFLGQFGDFAYMFNAAPTRPGIPLVDFWVQWQTFEAFRIRLGHFYAPFTIDNGYQQDFRSDFIERPMAMGSGNVISPDFRPGAEILGSFDEGIFKYWLAVTNTLDTNAPASGDPMVTGRIELNSWGFVMGGEGSWDRRPKGSTSFPGLTPGQFQFFTPVAIRGWEQRYGVNLDFYHGPFWFRSSFLWAVQRRDKVVAGGADGASLVTQGAYVTVGYKLWGPPAKAPRPDVPFRGWELFSLDLEKKHNKRDAGMDVACRVDWIDLRDARNAQRAPSGAPVVPSVAPDAARLRGNQAWAFSFGLNFSPIENVRIMADYVRLRTGDQARAEKEHSRWSDELLFRTQVDF